jgi:hypothetical protein
MFVPFELFSVLGEVRMEHKQKNKKKDGTKRKKKSLDGA